MKIIFFDGFSAKLGNILFIGANTKIRGYIDHLINLFNAIHKGLIILLSFE
jgi:hypothetical protein